MLAGVGISVDDINLSSAYLNPIIDSVTGSGANMLDLETKFTSALNVKDITQKVNELQDTVKISRNKAREIMKEVRKIKKDGANRKTKINSMLRIVNILNPNFLPDTTKIMPVKVDDFKNMEKFFQNVDSNKFFSALAKTLDGGVEGCAATVERDVTYINIPKSILQLISLEESSLPTIPIPTLSCDNYTFVEGDVFRNNLTSIFKNIHVTGEEGGGFSFRMPVPQHFAMPLATRYHTLRTNLAYGYKLNEDRMMKFGISETRKIVDTELLKIHLEMNNAFEYFDVIIGKSNEVLSIVSPPLYQLKILIQTNTTAVKEQFLTHYDSKEAADVNALQIALTTNYTQSHKAKLQRCLVVQCLTTLDIYNKIKDMVGNKSYNFKKKEIQKSIRKFNSYLNFKSQWERDARADNEGYNMRHWSRMVKHAKTDWTYRTHFMEIINYAVDKKYTDKRGILKDVARKTKTFPDDNDKLCSGFNLDALRTKTEMVNLVKDAKTKLQETILFTFDDSKDSKLIKIDEDIKVNEPWFKFYKKVSGHPIDERKIRDAAVTMKAWKKYFFGDLFTSKTYKCGPPSFSLPMDLSGFENADEILSKFADTFSWIPECLEYFQETKTLDDMKLPTLPKFIFRASRRQKNKQRAILRDMRKNGKKFREYPVWNDEGYEFTINMGDFRFDLKSGENTTFANNAFDDDRFCSQTNDTSKVFNKFCINLVRPFD